MRALARALAVLTAGMCLLVLAAWLLGRVVTDRWHWSQYLYWVPTAVVLVLAAALAFASWVFARAGGRNRATRRRAAPRMRTAAAIALLLAAGELALVEWRAHRFLLPPARPAGASVRILNWNVTRVESPDRIAAALAAETPDVVVLVNLIVRDRHALFTAFGPPLALVQDNGFAVMSRLPVLRHGTISLGLEGLPPGRGHRFPVDPGRALYFELDSTVTLGKTTIVWVLDMPSDWRLPRRELARRAAAAIAAWDGMQVDHDAVGGLSFRPGGPGFPAPDIVLGDFNIPRGSGSLALLAPGLIGAHEQGGRGRSESWPRPMPLVHIDQMFVAPWLRAWRYRVKDAGVGFHRMQVGDVAAAR